jgi:hypothetical protein
VVVVASVGLLHPTVLCCEPISCRFRGFYLGLHLIG